jgi:hypothetical protein
MASLAAAPYHCGRIMTEYCLCWPKWLVCLLDAPSKEWPCLRAILRWRNRTTIRIIPIGDDDCHMGQTNDEARCQSGQGVEQERCIYGVPALSVCRVDSYPKELAMDRDESEN